MVRRLPVSSAGRMALRPASMGAVLTAMARSGPTPTSRSQHSTMLFMTASHHLEAHKHADCLSLVWQDRGETLLARLRQVRLPARPDAGLLPEHPRAQHRRGGRPRLEPRHRRAYGGGHAPGRALGADLAHRGRGRPSPRGNAAPPPRPLPPAPLSLVLDHLARRPATGWRMLGAAAPGLVLPRRFTGWWHFGPAHAVPGRRSAARVTGLAAGRALVTHVGERHAGPRLELKRGAGGASPPRLDLAQLRRLRARPALGFAARARGDFRRHPFRAHSSPGRAPPARRRSPRAGVHAGPRRSCQPSHSASLPTPSPSTSPRGFSRRRDTGGGAVNESQITYIYQWDLFVSRRCAPRLRERPAWLGSR